MAMSVFYNLLKPTKQAVKPTTPRAKPVDSIITQVQKPSDATTINAVNQSSTPKGLFTMGKCLPTFMANCLNRKREEVVLRDENSTDGTYLIPRQSAANKGRKTLVLDLDETLVHSSFEKVNGADAQLSVTIKGTLYNFSVMIRPGTEEFLEKACENFEVVIFTASLMEYAKAIMKLINKKDLPCYILAREHCTQYQGVYVKDLTRLGRDLNNVILVDNSPNAFKFQPENAYHIKDFFDCKKDRELYNLTSCLEYINEVENVRPVKSHRMVFESKPTTAASTRTSISTEATVKTHREVTKTEQAVVKVAPQTARGVKTISAAETEALNVIRNLIEKKKGEAVKPNQLKASLLAAKVRTTEISKASKTLNEENVDELMMRGPIDDNTDDELDVKCNSETELPLMEMARKSTGSTCSESSSENGDAETDERIHYSIAVEARAC